MGSPIINANVDFTYAIANTLFSSSTSEGRTGSATYTGPDRIWVFVDAETNLFSQIQPPLTTVEDGADVPTPVGMRKVEVVAEDDPVVISIIREYEVTYADTTTTDETLPDGSTCTYNNVAELSETYEMQRLSHDGTSWDLGALDEPFVTWDDIIDSRNGALTASDGKISPDMPESISAPWVAYRTALRDLPATFKHGEADEIEAWKVNMPDHPED
mgnify:CR=1 FL=1